MKEAVHKVIFLPSQRTVTAKRRDSARCFEKESQPVSAICGGRGTAESARPL